MAALSRFGLLLHACGLSQEDGERFLKVGKKRIRQWIYGGVEPPPGVLAELEGLWRLISGRAEETVQKLSPSLPASLTEEQALLAGWPCLSAERRFQELVTVKALEKGINAPCFELVA